LNNTGNLIARNNIFYNLQTSGGATALYLIATGTIYARNNIIHTSEQGVWSSSASATNYYNCFYNVSVPNAGTFKKGLGIFTNKNPLFMSTNPTNMKTTWLRLDCASPCIDAGEPTDPVPAGGVVELIWGHLRPLLHNLPVLILRLQVFHLLKFAPAEVLLQLQEMD
jgi:hypothetical protein